MSYVKAGLGGLRWMVLFFLTVLVVTACSTPATEEAPATSATLFEGARLILGDGSDPIENGAFIVDGGQFTAVGQAGQLDVPEGAARVDLTGQTVMPAIIDAHKHVATTRDALVDQLEQFAYFGIGAVATMGRDRELAVQIREEPIPGAARLRTAGLGITAPEPGRNEDPYWVTTEEEARQAVDEIAATEPDIVKIWVDDRGGQYEKLSPELYGAVIDQAHQHNLRVTAHIFALEDAKGLLEAGIDAFAHSVQEMDVDDEFVELIRERPNVFLVPNLPNRGVAVDRSWLSGGVPPEELEELQASASDNPEAQERFGIQARNLDRLNDAGVRIAFGTDGGIPWAAHEELEDMVAAGMTPAEVLVAATSTSADLLEMPDAGRLQAGASADFIVLNANPLDDIRNTRQIASVYLRGAEVDRTALSARMSAPASE